MALKKNNLKSKKKLQDEQIIPNGCIVSKSLYEKKSDLIWLYRDEAINEMDSGWRAFGNAKDKDLLITDIDTLIKLVPLIDKVKDYPVGTDLAYHIDAAGPYFTETKTGTRLWF